MFVEWQWRCGTGQIIKILLHSSPPLSGRQYELYIDGSPFSSLPTIGDLGSQEYVNRHLAKRTNKLFSEFCTRSERSYNDEEVASSYSSSKNRRYVEGEHARAGFQSNLHDAQQQHRAGHIRSESSDSRQLRDRLATAGLSVQQDQEIVDELTLQSDYSTSLKTIRDDLIGTLPELEDVMSFAIINAFTEEEMGRDDDDWAGDSRSKRSSGSRSATMSGMVIEMPPTDPTGIEVDALCDAYAWMATKRIISPGTNSDHVKNEVLFQSERRTFLQDKVTHTIASVRHGHISALEASHIIQGIATILGMKLQIPLSRDTILLTKLNPETTAQSLRKQMEQYGPVDAAGTASSGCGFGKMHIHALISLMYIVYFPCSLRQLIKTDHLTLPMHFDPQPCADSNQSPTRRMLTKQDRGVTFKSTAFVLQSLSFSAPPTHHQFLMFPPKPSYRT